MLKKIDFDEADKPTSVVSLLKPIWTKESPLSLLYSKISIFYLAPHYTIVPNRLYDGKNKAHYLLPLKSSSETDKNFLADNLASVDSQLIFSIDKELVVFFDECYRNNYQLYHSFTSLIEGFSRQAGRGKEIYINVRDYTLQIFFFDNKELIFSNQFKFQSDKDFLYYILLIFDQFKLNPKEVPIKIAGSLSPDSAIYSQLYRYIQHLSFVNLPEFFKADLDLRNYPEHSFFDILQVST